MNATKQANAKPKAAVSDAKKAQLPAVPWRLLDVPEFLNEFQRLGREWQKRKKIIDAKRTPGVDRVKVAQEMKDFELSIRQIVNDTEGFAMHLSVKYDGKKVDAAYAKASEARARDPAATLLASAIEQFKSVPFINAIVSAYNKGNVQLMERIWDYAILLGAVKEQAAIVQGMPDFKPPNEENKNKDNQPLKYESITDDNLYDAARYKEERKDH